MTDSVAASISSGTAVDMGFVSRCTLALLAMYGSTAILEYIKMR